MNNQIYVLHYCAPLRFIFSDCSLCANCYLQTKRLSTTGATTSTTTSTIATSTTTTTTTIQRRVAITKTYMRNTSASWNSPARYVTLNKLGALRVHRAEG